TAGISAERVVIERNGRPARVEARRQQTSCNWPDFKAARHEDVGLCVIAPQQLFTAKSKGVMALGHGEVVGKFVAPQHLVVGEKDVRSKVGDAEDVKSHLGGLVGNDVHMVVATLRPDFILSPRAEYVEP